MTPTFRNQLKSLTRSASFLVSFLLLVTLASVGLEFVVAEPPLNATAKPESDVGEAKFVYLNKNMVINMENVAYTCDEANYFDIYFACSSTIEADPLRLTDEDDINHARKCFGTENSENKMFEKYDKYCIRIKHIAYMEFRQNSVTLLFTARIRDAFVKLILTGEDSVRFKKKREQL